MNKKRVLSAVLAMVMLIAMLPTAVLAAGTVGVTAGNAEIDQGTTSASVQISVSDNPGIAILGFDIGYDAAMMNIASVVVGDVFETGDVTAGDTSKNPYTFSAMKLEDVSANGNLVTINFTVKADCPAGTYPITLTAAEAYTIDEEVVDVSVSDGAVVVMGTAPAMYSVTVNGSCTGVSGEGVYAAGETVTLNAGNREGYTFEGWTSSDVTIENADSKVAVFVMPDKAVTVTANWKKNTEEPDHTHDFEDAWESNDTNHWRECKNKNCDEVDSMELHAPGAWQVEEEATETEEGRRCKYCTVCKKLLETEVIPATGDEDDGEDEEPENDTEKLPWWILFSGGGGKSFDDVTKSDWFYDDVDYVSDRGLMNGTSEDLFSPYDNTSRAMVVTILYRMAGEPYVYGGSSFVDVAEEQWYTEAVNWATVNDIVAGYGNGAFGTNDSVTREQLAAILYRYAQYCGKNVAVGEDLSGYADYAQISTWARTAMEWANAEGLINGRTETTIAPTATTNRAELAAVLHRFCERVS